MASTSSQKNGFKISGLPSIQNIDDKDLLLISDSEGGTYYSKSMSIQQLMDYISLNIAQNSEIQNQIKNIAESTVSDIVQNQIEEKTMNAVSANIEDIADLLDGKNDDQVNINAGSALANSVNN